MDTVQITATVLENADEAEQFLLAAGVVGPSLHPRVHDESTHTRWNGWNKAIAAGIDAAGCSIVMATHHYASGWHSLSVSRADELGRLGKRDFAFEEVHWPVTVLPAFRSIRHPEYTPITEGASA